MKICNKCGSSERYKSGDCKVCARKRAVVYQKKNQQQCQARKQAWAKLWRKNNAAAAKARSLYYRNKYKEKRRAYQAAYYAKHPEYWRAWRANNRSKCQTAYRKWLAANPELAKEARRRWRQANPALVLAQLQRRRAKRYNAKGSHTFSQGICRTLMFGGLCWVCNRNPGLCLDHVIALCNNGQDWPSNIRPICSKCNGAKGNWESKSRKSITEIMTWAIQRRNHV